jgi:hypothetical protein
MNEQSVVDLKLDENLVEIEELEDVILPGISVNHNETMIRDTER